MTTALVVDDSNSMRLMLAHALKLAGFAVVEAKNGVEALARLAENKVEVILTDLNMPGMDGIALIQKVRAAPQTKFTPILMLTTESQGSQKDAGRAAGATGWIVKPFDPETLVKTVKRVLP